MKGPKSEKDASKGRWRGPPEETTSSERASRKRRKNENSNAGMARAARSPLFIRTLDGLDSKEVKSPSPNG